MYYRRKLKWGAPEKEAAPNEAQGGGANLKFGNPNGVFRHPRMPICVRLGTRVRGGVDNNTPDGPTPGGVSVHDYRCLVEAGGRATLGVRNERYPPLYNLA